MVDFADYLKESREKAGLNQSELALEVGLTGSYISVLESRRKPPPSDTVLRRLANALGRPEEEMLEIAHLDRTPADIREKIRALDRRLKIEQKASRQFLFDLLPSSLWHFWRIRGYQEYGLARVRLDGRKKSILRKVLRRIGHLTTRSDFLEESRAAIEALPDEDRAVLLEVIPELVADEPRREAGAGAAANPAGPAFVPVPLVASPPGKRDAKPIRSIPVEAGHSAPDAFWLAARDGDMSPVVLKGDLLLVAPLGNPEAGDLVLARIAGRWTARWYHPGGGRDRALLTAGSPEVPPAETPLADLGGVILEIRRRLRGA